VIDRNEFVDSFSQISVETGIFKVLSKLADVERIRFILVLTVRIFI